MKFRQLAVVLSVLLSTYGDVSEDCATHIQEDCAGAGNLTAAVRMFHLSAARRDVSKLRLKLGFWLDVFAKGFQNQLS